MDLHSRKPIRVERSAVWRTVALGAALLLSGCSDPSKGYVTGTVVVDGAPAKSGSIDFFPVDRALHAAGGLIVDGAYSAEVPLGASRVEIHVSKVVGQKKLYDTPDSPIRPLMAEALPAKYNDATELTIDVKPGENRQDYDLSTK